MSEAVTFHEKRSASAACASVVASEAASCPDDEAADHAVTERAADLTADLPAAKGRKLFLVQEYEYYRSAAPDERARMEQGFRAGFETIAISPAVAAMLTGCGAPVAR